MVLLFWLFFLAHDVLLSVLVAIVLSTGFDALASALEEKKVPRVLAVLFIFLVLISIIGILFYAILPVAFDELSGFISTLNHWLGTSIAPALQKINILDLFSQSLSQYAGDLLSGGGSILHFLGIFLGGILSTVTIIVLTFYLTLDKHGMQKFLVSILPPAYEARGVTFYLHVREKISRWLLGQFVLSVVLGLIVFIGLMALGVKYALILGIIAGILELVPFVGPILSGALAVVIALAVSWKLALSVLIFFIIVQQIESNLLAPVITKFTADINPAVVVISLLIGFKVLGVMGLILAVPLAVAVGEFFDVLSENRERLKGQRLL